MNNHVFRCLVLVYLQILKKRIELSRIEYLILSSWVCDCVELCSKTEQIVNVPVICIAFNVSEIIHLSEPLYRKQ